MGFAKRLYTREHVFGFGKEILREKSLVWAKRHYTRDKSVGWVLPV